MCSANELLSQMTTYIDRQDVNQRKYKHPDQIDEVPVETANLNIFMIYLLDPRGYNSQVDDPGSDVKHVQAGNREEGRTEQWRRQSSVRSGEGLHPVLR